MHRFKKLEIQEWAVIILFLFYIPFHIIMTPGYWDDAAFSNLIKNYNFNLIQYTVDRYHLWSSRIVIELILPFMTILPSFIWKICNLFMIGLLYFDLKWLLANVLKMEQKKYEILLALLLCAFPFSTMAQTGWIATTMNYLWVIALGLYGINCMLKPVLAQKGLSKRETIFGSLAVLYSASYETMTAIIFIIAVGIIFYSLKNKKKISSIIWIELGITVVMLFYILGCPGNQIRTVKDAETWMPDYSDMTIWDRFRVGVLSTFMNFVSIPSPLFFLFNLVIFLWQGQKGKKEKIVSAIPLILDILWTGYFLANYLLGYKTFTYQVPSALLNSGKDIVEQSLLLITVLIWFVIVFGTIFQKMQRGRAICCSCLLIIACAPEMVVGITPTVFASILRTTIYLYMAFIIVIICICSQMEFEKNRNIQKFIYICAIGGMVLNACQIARHIVIYG